MVLDVLRGPDLNEMDPSAFDAELDDPFRVDPASLTVGFLGNVPSSVRLVCSMGACHSEQQAAAVHSSQGCRQPLEVSQCQAACYLFSATHVPHLNMGRPI